MNHTKPFYFFVVVWGETFCHYLTQYCIPSLFAPNNIAVLSNHPHNKFLICTTQKDWQWLQSTSIINTLNQHLTVVFLEIPFPQPGVTGCQHMGIGHKLATTMCFNDQVYGVPLTPDLLFADGTLTQVEKRARAGDALVLCAGIRSGEEPLFKSLHDLGIRSMDQQAHAQPLTITARQLVKCLLQSPHSEMQTYDFESPSFSTQTPMALWHLPKQQGCILHTLSWCPLLIDYGALTEHSTAIFDSWTMDGDYLYQHFKNHDRIYACTDSDDMLLAAWSPLSYQLIPVKAGILRRWYQPLCRMINRYLLFALLRRPIFDPLKLQLFPTPIFWHTEDLDDTWEKKARDIQTILAQQGKLDDVFFHYGLKIIRIFYKIARYTVITMMALLGSPWARQKFITRNNSWNIVKRIFRKPVKSAPNSTSTPSKTSPMP